MTTNDSPAAKRIAEVFVAGKVAAKHIDAFGSHVIVTCHCHATALQAGRLLERAGWKVNGPKIGIDYLKQSEGRKPEPVEVYRVGGKLA